MSRVQLSFHDHRGPAHESVEHAERRATFLAAWEAFKPAKRRRPSYPVRPGALEKTGTTVLEHPDRSEARSKGVVVRVYYRSEGGEVLCFDTAPLTEGQAEELENEHRERAYPQAFDAATRKWTKRPGSWGISDALGTERRTWKLLDTGSAAGEAPPPRAGARLVVLPSQSRACPVLCSEPEATNADSV